MVGALRNRGKNHELLILELVAVAVGTVKRLAPPERLQPLERQGLVADTSRDNQLITPKRSAVGSRHFEGADRFVGNASSAHNHSATELHSWVLLHFIQRSVQNKESGDFPSKPSALCAAEEKRLRGSPPSMTRTDCEPRPKTKAAESPANDPPTTM